jgi:hypothetical protein
VFKSEKCTLIKSDIENWKCAFFTHTDICRVRVQKQWIL